MFQSDLESMIDRYAIIRRAVLYREDLAIAAIDEPCERVTAAKAADELLTLSGVQASFVFYPKDDGVYISARSLGEVNVQVIVEALGGGGNSTSAGGQLPGVTVEQVCQKLQEAMNTMRLQEKAKAKADAEAKAAATEIAEKLKGLQVKVASKGGEGGKLFGAVTGREIAAALKEQHGVDIDSKKLVLDEPIKSFGSYQVKAKLGFEISGTVYVIVTEEK